MTRIQANITLSTLLGSRNIVFYYRLSHANYGKSRILMMSVISGHVSQIVHVNVYTLHTIVVSVIMYLYL